MAPWGLHLSESQFIAGWDPVWCQKDLRIFHVWNSICKERGRIQRQFHVSETWIVPCSALPTPMDCWVMVSYVMILQQEDTSKDISSSLIASTAKWQTKRWVMCSSYPLSLKKKNKQKADICQVWTTKTGHKKKKTNDNLFHSCINSLAYY